MRGEWLLLAAGLPGLLAFWSERICRPRSGASVWLIGWAHISCAALFLLGILRSDILLSGGMIILALLIGRAGSGLPHPESTETTDEA